MPKGKILVAHDPSGLFTIESALHGYELVIATDFMKAELMIIEDGIDCIVIGIHFDYSRAVELVSAIHKSEKHKTTPVILVRYSPSTNEQMLRFTVNQFIDLGTVKDYLELEHDADAAEKLRAAVDACFVASGELH
jgi:hypothetical protein